MFSTTAVLVDLFATLLLSHVLRRGSLLAPLDKGQRVLWCGIQEGRRGFWPREVEPSAQEPEKWRDACCYLQVISVVVPV